MRTRRTIDHTRRAQAEARLELADLARRFKDIVRNPPRSADWRPTQWRPRLKAS